MASHPHRHCHHPASLSSSTAAAAYCYCCSYIPPPEPHLFHLIPQPHVYSPHPNHLTQTHHQTHNFEPNPNPNPYRSRNLHEEEETNPTISSLLRRIDALESSLRRQSSSSSSLRHVAARTIQAHFRSYLIRRSATLRHLQHLSFIKSSLNALKSSLPLSSTTPFNPRPLSRKLTDLLLNLHSIKGGDPMIRDGKRSIHTELIRFMEYIDRVSSQSPNILRTTVNKVRVVGTKSRGDRELMENLRDRLERIHRFSTEEEEEEEEEEQNVEVQNPSNKMRGLLKRQGGVQSKVKKNVSFADNGNVYRVIRSTHGKASDGDCNSNDGSDSIDAEREHLENFHIQVEQNGVSSNENEDEEANTEEDEESCQLSDDQSDPMRNFQTEGDYQVIKHDQEDGSFLFSAPLPLKMEPRPDSMKKNKAVKLVIKG